MIHRPGAPGHLSGIGATALGVAVLRALESRRPDRLFDDPYAQWFLDASARPAGLAESFLRTMSEQVAVRTRFLDDALLAATRGEHAGPVATCDQVVLLGCGMDARAYRLSWPAGTTVHELDLPDVLAFKGAVLAAHGATPACRRVEVAADLREDWPRALTQAGFDPHRPAAWLAEGLLYALPPEAADLLLDRVTGLSAPGSVLAVEHMEDSPLLRSARADVSRELVDLWQGGPAEPLGEWLTKRGWIATVRDLTEVLAEHGRTAPPAFDPAQPGSGRGRLATALLRATSQSFSRGA
ncbi:SAM-dependent methyltransferase [Nonomuraea aridisoli]|uniref:S-adenosyl-L-methionine-dependent methyltransferase n=1 Tax=Nonomuraea aridisoli TaxID=2070368 RepID=A0A2W2EAL7_9ACTN|nr:SAM-dependent methyltransferase [Nonomuraea aridisoli]PZG14165.1 SAM-dependent methyltransferase [Nonomuraea aridisoli]